MGVVYEAEQVSLGRHVALKVLPTKALLDARQKRRFEREARAAAKLHHTNIVPVYGVGEHDGLPYYVMQFIQGLGLDAVIGELRRQRDAAGTTRQPAVVGAAAGGLDLSAEQMAHSLMTGRFALAPAVVEGNPAPATIKVAYAPQEREVDPAAEPVTPSSSSVLLPGQSDENLASGSRRPTYWQSVARIGVQVADALEHAHRQGVLHRDVKPSNLLLDMQGTVWVTDFGLAKADDQENLTHTGDVLGTLRYMPPEALEGKADPRGDVYSLGLTLYELLAFRPAFDAADPNKLLRQVGAAEPARLDRLDPRIPSDIVTVVHKAMERSPAHRYASAGELRADLQRFLNGEPIQARRVGELERLWKWVRRHPAVAGLLLAVVVTLVLGAGVSTYFAVLAGDKARQAIEQRESATRNATEAEHARALATKEAGRAQEAGHQAVRQVAELTLQSGQAQAQSGEVARGMFTMLDAWRTAPADADDLRRVIRLNLAAWSRQLPVLLRAGDMPLSSFLQWDGAEGKTFFSLGGGHADPKSESHLGGVIQRYDGVTLQPVGRPWPIPPDAFMRAFRDDPPVVLLSQGSTYWTLDPATGRKLGKAVSLDFPARGVLLASPRFAVVLKLLPFRPEVAHQAVPVVVDFQRGTTIRPDVKLIGTDSLGVVTTRQGQPALVVYHASASGGDDAPPRASYWDLSTGNPVPELDYPRMAADPRVRWDGRSLLWVQANTVAVPAGAAQQSFAMGHDTRDASARWLDAATGKARGETWQPRRLGTAAHLTSDGRTLFVGSVDNRVRLYDLGLGLQRGGDLPEQHVFSDRFAAYPDGGSAAVISCSGLVRLWQTGECLLQNTAGSNPRPPAAARRLPRPDFSAVAYHPATAQAVVLRGPGFGYLTHWTTDQPTGQPLKGDLAHATFSPDGRLLATASHPDDVEPRTLVRIWDARTGRPRVPALPCPRFIRRLAFSPDSRTLAVACVAMTLLVDASTGRPVHTLPEASAAQQLAFSPDGKTLAVAYLGGWTGVGAGLHLWDVASGKPAGDFRPFQDPEANPSQVLFGDQGRSVVVLWNSATIQGEIPGSTAFQVYDGRTGKPRGRPVSVGKEQGRAVLSPDGTRLAAADMSGLVQQWDTTTGTRHGTAMPQADLIRSLAYSPDGHWLAVACHDQGVRLWDAATCRSVGPPLVHRAPVIGMTFTPDSRVLVSTTAAGFTRTWSLPQPVADNADEVEQWLRATSGVMVEGSDVVLLDEAAWKKEAAAARPVVAGQPLGDGRPWQDRLAREAEEDGDPRAALWHLDRLVQQRPDDWRLYARRARVFGRLGELDRAAKEYARAQGAGAGEELLDEYRHRAAACRLLGELATSLWYLDRLVAVRPDDWHGYADRAEVHALLKKLPEHAADVIRAIDLGADSSVLVPAAEERARAGDWRGAAELLGRAVAEGNREPDVLMRFALCRLRAGDAAGYRRLCETQLKEVAELWPDQKAHPVNILCPLCALGTDALGDWRVLLAMAEAVVRRAVEQSQPALVRGQWLRLYGRLLYRAGRYQEASARLHEGLALNPEEATADRLFLAMAHHRLGHVQEARRQWDKARGASPAGDFWAQVETQLLRDEAQALLAGK
jgi:WD40 repeat protein/tetratricopeptide (TPR) repeat protein